MPLLLDKDEIHTQLSSLWDDDNIRVLEIENQKYAIISDLHMGNGSEADDFHKNKPALLNALDYYKENNYILILLGDIEEFWQFDLKEIVDQYGDTIYAKFREFGNDRIYRIFGNHDYEWGGYVDPIKTGINYLGYADEALKLIDKNGNICILLVHGHQGVKESDKWSWFSRFFLRLYVGIEPIVRRTNFSLDGAATKSQVTRDYEKTLYSWAKKNKTILICGHSHRAIFASKSYADRLRESLFEFRSKISNELNENELKKINRKLDKILDDLAEEGQLGRTIDTVDPIEEPKPCYFNAGCGLYTDGITTIEIADGTIRLMKWNNPTQKMDDSVEYVSDSVSSIINKIT